VFLLSLSVFMCGKRLKRERKKKREWGVCRVKREEHKLIKGRETIIKMACF